MCCFGALRHYVSFKLHGYFESTQINSLEYVLIGKHIQLSSVRCVHSLTELLISLLDERTKYHLLAIHSTAGFFGVFSPYYT